MGIPVLEGRGFTASDDQSAPPVVMINQTLAKVFYPNQSPIGKRLRVFGTKDLVHDRRRAERREARRRRREDGHRALSRLSRSCRRISASRRAT